jgi:hypothetical protein
MFSKMKISAKCGLAISLFVFLVSALGQFRVAVAAEAFASVYKLRGEVVARDNASGGSRLLKQGDPVFISEQIHAAQTGEAVFLTNDRGVIGLRPNGVFQMEQFRAANGPDDKFDLRIFRGALRLISGLIGKTNKENYRVSTPTATLGIRGTDFETYVLDTGLSASFGSPEGTYDKVNRGATVLSSGSFQLEVDVGRVGFVSAAPSRKSRGLLTVLMPVLLETVPSFFVPGAFDSELDELSVKAQAIGVSNGPSKDAESSTGAIETVTSTEAPKRRYVSDDSRPNPSSISKMETGSCQPELIAGTWLGRYDDSISARDAAAFLALFSPSAKVIAMVRSVDGTIIKRTYTSGELAQSTIEAMQNLSDFATRRFGVKAVAEGGLKSAKNCQKIRVESLVVESGVMKGNPYRLEATENFVLEWKSGRWIATEASTAQR